MASELEFELRDDGTLMVSKGADQNKVEIPGSVDGTAVTAIGRSAFKNMSRMEFISIPDTVSFVDDEAFSGCTGLRYIDVEGTLRSIGSRAFAGCKEIRFIDLKEGLESIGNRAFDKCDSLVLHDLPASLKNLGRGALAGCTLMKSVTIGKDGAYKVEKGGIVDTRTSELVAVCPGTSGMFSVPRKCKRIISDAFDGCTEITSILIPSSVEDIESGSFRECRKLREFMVQRGSTNFRSCEDG